MIPFRHTLTCLSLTLGLAFTLASTATAGTLEDLRKERTAINRAIRKAVPDATKLDPQLAELQRVSLDASKANLQALAQHPSLTEVNAELRKANDELAKAITQKDDTARQSILDRITALQHRRMAQAAAIPELAKLAQEASDTGTAYFTREREFLSTHPDTKDLMARLLKLNEEIQAEMKKK